MNSRQYTIRSVPAKIDQALRRRADQTGKSLNQVAVETLARGAGVDIETDHFEDLDWFVGALRSDRSLDDAIKWLDQLPAELD